MTMPMTTKGTATPTASSIARFSARAPGSRRSLRALRSSRSPPVVQTRDLHALTLGRAARRPGPQLRRCPDRDPARDRVLSAQRARRATRRPRGRSGDLRLRLRRALRDDPALYPPAAPDASVGARSRRLVGFVGNELAARCVCRPAAARKRRDDRRRKPRPRRRLRLARPSSRARSWSRSAPRSPTRSSASPSPS